MSESAPESRRRRRRSWLSPVWLVPILAAGAAAYIVHRKAAEEGPSIDISFERAEGLQASKSDLRYLGVKLGEVQHLALADDGRHVVATVKLERSADALAKRGAKFWIVRPQISAAGVQGLSTIITGAYIEAVPGHGEDEDHFVGLEEPPPISGDRQALELYLLSDRDATFEEGSPVYYRGIKVGATAASELSGDSRQVRTRVLIDGAYARLVKDNSRFWNAGGIHFHFGLLSGANMSAKSLTALVEGGVAFATPDKPGGRIQPGQTFKLYDKPDGAWLKWRPSLPVRGQEPEAVQ